MSPDEIVIRQVESDVLDTHHRRCQLLTFHDDLAITRLLKVFGDLSRDVVHDVISQGHSQLGLHARASLMTRGLSHALRWVCTECGSGPSVQSRDWQAEDRIALDFLGWSLQYARIATDHVAWSNSLITASADTRTRLINFHPAGGLNTAYLFRQGEADMNWWREELCTGYPADEFVMLFNDWQRDAERSETGIDFEPPFIRSHRVFSTLQDWMRQRLFPDLSESQSLGQYSLGELRHFFTVLYFLCECIRTFENEADKRFGLENTVGTFTFQLPRNEFVEWLRQATDLSYEKVDAIVEDMTLNPCRFHCSISNTPFVLSRNGTLFLLPRFLAFLHPQRTMAAALTSGSGRAWYDAISTALERAHLPEIEATLSRAGLIVLREKQFRFSSGEVITPDFLVSDQKMTSIAVIDYKNSLAATAVAEVTNRLKEYRKGLAQIEHYLECFEANPQALAQFFPGYSGGLPLKGMMLFRVPMPLPVKCSTRVVADDWLSLRKRIHSIDKATLSTILPDDLAHNGEGAYSTESITVGDWTYQRSLLLCPEVEPTKKVSNPS
jgi:hypothetical protein